MLKRKFVESLFHQLLDYIAYLGLHRVHHRLLSQIENIKIPSCPLTKRSATKPSSYPYSPIVYSPLKLETCTPFEKHRVIKQATIDLTYYTTSLYAPLDHN